MILNDLINQTTWTDIQIFFHQSHYFRDKNRSARLRKKVIYKYLAVYEELLKLKPAQSKIRLEIIKNEEGSYVDVSGLDGSLYGQSEDYCAEADLSMAEVEIPFSLVALEWEKWLGSEITEETLKTFSEIEIAAHCIWEMTFFGLNQEAIQANFK